MINCCIVGSGKRVRSHIIPALIDLSQFNISHIISRNKGDIIEINNATFFTEDISEIDFIKIDVIYLGVNFENVFEILKSISNLSCSNNINIILDTPLFHPKNIFKKEIFKRFKSISVLEDTLFNPINLEIKNIIDSGHIGIPTKLYFFHSGFKYHAISLIKKIFDINFFTFVFNKKYSKLFSEINFFNGSRNLSTIFEPRDYSCGRFLVIGSKGRIQDYPLKEKDNLENIINLRNLINTDYYEGISFIKGNDTISKIFFQIPYKLNYEENISEQINKFQKIEAVKKFFSEYSNYLSKRKSNLYTMHEGLYDAWIIYIITKFKIFFDFEIPFIKKSFIYFLIKSLY